MCVNNLQCIIWISKSDKNISFILNDVQNRAVSPRVRKSLVVKTLFEKKIFLPSKWVHLFQNYSFKTNNEQIQSEEYSSLKNHTKI